MSELHADAARLLGDAVAEVTTRAIEPALQPFRDDLSALRDEIRGLATRMEERAVDLDDAAKESSDALADVRRTLADFRAQAELRADEVTRLRDELDGLRLALRPLPALLDRLRTEQVRQDAAAAELAQGRTELVRTQVQINRQLAQLKILVLRCGAVVVVLLVVIAVLLSVVIGG